jgi:hypothetical protein
MKKDLEWLSASATPTGGKNAEYEVCRKVVDGVARKGWRKHGESSCVITYTPEAATAKKEGKSGGKSAKKGKSGGKSRADGLPEKTGLEPIDKGMSDVLAWEKSHLSNPFIQIGLLGLAGYGVYILAGKALRVG